MPRHAKLLTNPPNRIQHVRLARDLTLEEVANRTRTTRQTISRLEKGEMELTVSWLIKLSKATGACAVDLLPEECSTPVATKIVGRIGQGQQLIADDSIPPLVHRHHGSSRCVAAIVDGDAMLPVYRAGDLLFWELDAIDPEKLIGKECMVDLQDGRSMVKTIQRGSKPGLYRLTSYAAADIDNVRIVAAMPIDYVQRHR